MLNKTSTADFPLAEFREYVAARIVPVLAPSGSPFRLEPTALGNRNIIFFLHLPDRMVKVIKGFKRKNRIKNNLIANRFLTRCDINVPRMHWADVSYKAFKTFGHYFVCEEKIEGITLADIGHLSEALPLVAGFYARMHAVRSSRWGRLTSGRKYGFGRFIMDRIDKRLAGLHHQGALPEKEDVRYYREWFHDRSAVLKTIKLFSLCHGDVNTRNIMLCPDKQVVIIDNEAIKYLPLALELYRLTYAVCAGDPGAERLFERSYLEHSSPSRREEFGRCCDFFKAYVMLEYAWFFSKKLRSGRTPEPARPAYASYCTLAVGRFREATHP